CSRPVVRASSGCGQIIGSRGAMDVTIASGRTYTNVMEKFDDMQLLRQYAATHSEEAFAALVSRHLNLVYSAALRQVQNPHYAEEIAQAVFLILARKCRALRSGVILSGWLYQTAR